MTTGILRRARKPVLLAANKVDDPSHEADALEFHRLGLGDPIPVSALHGHGTGEAFEGWIGRLLGADFKHHIQAPARSPSAAAHPL